jgi:hypothetical protein
MDVLYIKFITSGKIWVTYVNVSVYSKGSLLRHLLLLLSLLSVFHILKVPRFVEYLLLVLNSSPTETVSGFVFGT